MKEFVKNICAVIVVCIMIILGVAYLGKLISPYKTYDAKASIDAFHDLEENTVEVIVYGSSHAWRGFDVMLCMKSTGLEHIIMGAIGNILIQRDYLLKILLEHKNLKLF